MRGTSPTVLYSALFFSAAAVFLLAPANSQTGTQPTGRLMAKARLRRLSPSDLEIGGELAGLPPGNTRYVTRADLLTLPQVSFTVTDDPNFAGPAKVSGILLEDLVRDLAAD